MSNLNHLRKYEILCAAEVCQLIGVSRSTLWRYTKTLGMPYCKKKGSRPFYFKSEVLAWLKNQKKPSLIERKGELTVDGFIHK